jgi:dTDP-4-dehydrorhamnose reductase
VNVEATRNLAYVISERPSGYFVFISTACVFSGDEPDRFYTENDVPYPKNFYGLTKFLAENLVKNTADLRRTLLTLIIRTNFVSRGKWMYTTAFTDRFGTYLYSDQVAAAVIKFVDQRRTGTIHICGDRRVSMYELAKHNDLDVKPMTLQNYEGPPLTVNMCLSSTIVPRIQLDA